MDVISASGPTPQKSLVPTLRSIRQLHVVLASCRAHWLVYLSASRGSRGKAWRQGTEDRIVRSLRVVHCSYTPTRTGCEMC